MAHLLTPRQRDDMHNSIVNYLKELDIDKATLLNVQKTLEVKEIRPDNNLLPRKWTAIVRLQKKITDLEARISAGDAVDPEIFSQKSPGLMKLQWLPKKVANAIPIQQVITCIRVHPIQPIVFIGTDSGKIVVYDLMDLTQPLKSFQAHTKAVTSIAISSEKFRHIDGEPLVLASSSKDLFIKLWNLTDYTMLRSMSGHDHIVSCVAFYDGSNKLVSASRDKNVKLWDLSNGYCENTFQAHSDWVRHVDTAGEYAITCSNDASLRLSHVSSGNGIGICIGHEFAVEVVKFVPMQCIPFVEKLVGEIDNGKYEEVAFKYALSAGRDNTIKLWLLPLPVLRPHRPPVAGTNPKGKLLHTFEGHASWVRDLAFHPTGQFFFSSSDDKHIRVWDFISGTSVTSLKGHDGFVSSIDFASPLVTTVLETENEELKLKQLNDSIRCIFVSGSTDENVNVWA